MRFRPLFSVSVLVLAALGIATNAAARPIDGATTHEHTQNLHPLGHSFFPNDPNFPGVTFTANSDLAFWGNLAFQGHYRGFRIVDISAPANPKEISFTECFGNQGDVVVWGNILVRSWNSPATGTGSSQLSCDGQPVPMGFEGLHIFDISNLSDPVLVGEVELSARPVADGPGCGSHTATGVPDLTNNRLLIYNQTSGGPCPFVGIVEVPLDDPASASFIRNEPLEEADACHDSAVILGDVNMMACASHAHANVYDIGDNQWPGGSLEDPAFLYNIEEPGVGIGGNWHSAGFTWDGEVIILGWEPAGGGGPRCTATGTLLPGGVIQTDTHKSAFFYDSETGAKLGQWVLPRDQTVEENCTIHNYNVVPTEKRYILVSGNYQSGISVVDFSDPANATEIAYADPSPLPHPPGTSLQLGGDWSTYWYNGFIYESDITRGLLVWNLSDNATAGARRFDHSNPQTQETSIG